MEEENQGRKTDILWYLIFLLTLILLIAYWEIYIDVSMLTSRIEPLLPKIIAIIITLLIVKIFLKVTLPIVKKTVSLRFKTEDWKVIRMLYIYFVWFIALIIVLSGLFGNLSSLGLSLSLIGAGVALALQQVILSFAAWFLIIIKRPYKIGDRIYIKGKDILGDVEEITMLFTVLKGVAENETVTGKNVIIPNSTVFLEPVINYSYDIPQIWLSIPVSVTYESDLDLAERLIFKAASEVAGEEMRIAARLMKLKTPDSVQVEFAREEPLLRVEFGDSSVNIRVRVMCIPKHVPFIRSDIYKKVFEEFNRPEHRDKVEIAYPHMELVLHDEVMSENVKRFFRDRSS